MTAAILLSGGIDSATALAMAGADATIAIGFDYGQEHRIELGRAQQIADHYGVPFQSVKLPIYAPNKTDAVVFDCRNAAFIGVGALIASSHGCDAIHIGANASDWARFPDCRPGFYDALRAAYAVAEYGVRISTPLLHMTKTDVVSKARSLGVPLELTWSCYAPTPDEQQCGECLACQTKAAAGA